MKKTICAIAAAAILGAGALAPAPASALTPTSEGLVPLTFLPLVPFMLALGAKEDKNFKAVNPYAKKTSKHKRRM